MHRLPAHCVFPATGREEDRGVGARLQKRGDLTVWLSDDALDSWRATPSGKPGGQRTYANVAIEAALTIRMVFHLPLRQTEGFLTLIEQLEDPVASVSANGASNTAGVYEAAQTIIGRRMRSRTFAQNLSFIDPNEIGYQVYPGFELSVPELDDAD